MEPVINMERTFHEEILVNKIKEPCLYIRSS